ncbi:MAG: response regulator transcription factor [Actinobacteria bacterium]|nr:MAG: response regulator transcription factor [Actinomycetota bacterium]
MLRIAIVDDHRVVRDGIEAVLGRDTEFEVVGAYEAGCPFIASLDRCEPDVVVMDMRLPDGLGADFARRAKQVAPSVRILILTGVRSEAEMVMALEAGVDGYLLKDSSSDDLPQAVREVAAGNFYASPEVMRRMRDLSVANGESVTPREAEVLVALRDGLTTDEIGERLHMSASTVKTHLAHLYRKLEARNRVEAVREAIRRGLVEEA